MITHSHCLCCSYVPVHYYCYILYLFLDMVQVKLSSVVGNRNTEAAGGFCWLWSSCGRLLTGICTCEDTTKNWWEMLIYLFQQSLKMLVFILTFQFYKLLQL